MGLVGIWLAIAIDEWTRAIIMFFRWKSRAWERYALVKPQEQEEIVLFRRSSTPLIEMQSFINEIRIGESCSNKLLEQLLIILFNFYLQFVNILIRNRIRYCMIHLIFKIYVWLSCFFLTLNLSSSTCNKFDCKYAISFSSNIIENGSIAPK